MAFAEFHYHSDALKKAVTVNVILPESAKTVIGMKADGGATYKTLFLLHGLSDDNTIWTRRTSIERYAAEYGIAVVMPNGDRSWYTDMVLGGKYFTFITEELPNVCRRFFRGMSDRREDTLIGGLSMGGYGAVKAALHRPDIFGGCISLSGALDLAAFKDRPEMADEWKAIFGPQFSHVSDLKGTDHDLLSLADRWKTSDLPFPDLFVWCGESDFLLEQNRSFHQKLTELDLPHFYCESEGNHSWKWWDLHIQDGLKYLLNKEP